MTTKTTITFEQLTEIIGNQVSEVRHKVAPEQAYIDIVEELGLGFLSTYANDFCTELVTDTGYGCEYSQATRAAHKALMPIFILLVRQELGEDKPRYTLDQVVEAAILGKELLRIEVVA